MAQARWLLASLLVLGLATPVAGGCPPADKQPKVGATAIIQLTGVAVETGPDGITVQVKTSEPAHYGTSLIENPTRLIIDLDKTEFGGRCTSRRVGVDPLREVRWSQFKEGVARVVLEFSQAEVDYKIEPIPTGLLVRLEPSAAAGFAKEEPPEAIAKVEPEIEPGEPPAMSVAAPEPDEEDLLAQGEAASPVAVSAPLQLAQRRSSQFAAESGERLISLDFKDAEIVNLLRILAAEADKNIVAGEDVSGKISVTLKNVTWDTALDTILETRGLRKVEKGNVIRIVSLEQLAKDEEAKAKADEAKLKAEAEIRTKIAEAQIKEQEAVQRRLAAEAALAEAEARGPLKEAMIRLSYADPDEVVNTLIGILGISPEGTAEAPAVVGPPPIAEQPFAALYGAGAQPPPAPPPPSAAPEVLAKGITIRAHKPTNSVFIRHYEGDLERITKLIKEELDIPLPQVKIQARMEILDREDLFAIGVQWGGAGAARDGTTTLVGQGFSQRIDVGSGQPVEKKSGRVGDLPPIGSPSRRPAGPLAGSPVFSTLLPIDPSTGLPTGGNIINLPIGALLGGAASAGAGGFVFGLIGNDFNLNLALEALKTEGKTKTLARPEIITVENNTAVMSLGEEIPFATVSSAGTKIEFKEALLKLEVTPTVIQEGEITKIKMKVLVENNSRGLTVINLGTAGAPPVINKRKTETEVLIKEGDHLIIGGVSQSLAQQEIRKVPFLGDIPLLGWLFKQKGIQNKATELVVFISPTVVRTNPAQATQRGTPKYR